MKIDFTPLSPDHRKYVKECPKMDENASYSDVTPYIADAWDAIQEARELGGVLVVAGYRGGHDEGYYDFEGLYAADGTEIPFNSQNKWGEHPLAILAVNKALGYFSGAGDGTDYGGTVHLRLDTLQAREVEEWSMQRVDSPSEDDWK